MTELSDCHSGASRPVHARFAGRGEDVVRGGCTYEITWDYDHPWFEVKASGMSHARFAELVTFAGNAVLHFYEPGKIGTIPFLQLSRIESRHETENGGLRFDVRICVTRRSTRYLGDKQNVVSASKLQIDELARILEIGEFIRGKLAEEAQMAKRGQTGTR